MSVLATTSASVVPSLLLTSSTTILTRSDLDLPWPTSLSPLSLSNSSTPTTLPSMSVTTMTPTSYLAHPLWTPTLSSSTAPQPQANTCGNIRHQTSTSDLAASAVKRTSSGRNPPLQKSLPLVLCPWEGGSSSGEVLTPLRTTPTSWKKTPSQTADQASIPNTASAKRVPWWNKQCAKELHVKRANWKRYQWKRGSPMEDHAYILYKRASAVFCRTIHSAKRAQLVIIPVQHNSGYPHPTGLVLYQKDSWKAYTASGLDSTH
ncbi:hypothetical protein Pcinc_010045 [Petrolisthes cinctipes]|uniref:Uncharacterized protein n=1 Tax=Petrolisthes cinctipes TaxID=88211 RepID=A0AAE1G9U1_PETCI|nr:hypothetical protein Pcinc_010045 [Petrolisthes cinctipes]